MMAKAMQLVFFLFMLVETTLCDAVFKLVNSSVQLDIQKDLKISNLYWKFNKSTNIVFKYKDDLEVYGSYKDSVEVNKETNSLTLKNLQKNDSGVYEAENSDERREIVATYKLYVLDPVEKPFLNDSIQKNNETCNVTLTCEAQNLSVTSHCYSNNCDKNEAKSEFLFLSLYVNESFIICNYSNPVSWKDTTIEIKHVEERCDSEDEKIGKPSGNDKNTVLLPIIIGVFFIILVFLCFWWWGKKRSNVLNLNDVNTCYEEVGSSNKSEQKRQSAEMSNINGSPTTLYTTVGMPGQTCSKDESTVSTASLGNKDQEAETNHNTGNIDSPCTIYATVTKVHEAQLD